MLIILLPSIVEASHPGLIRQFESMQSVPQPIALMSIATCLESGRLCLVHLILRQPSQRLSMARYATGSATDIQHKQDSNPVLTSTSKQVAGMQFSSHES